MQKSEYTSDDFLPIMIPTKANKGYFHVVMQLYMLANSMGKLPLLATSDAPTQMQARTECLKKLKKVWDENGVKYGAEIRGLWYDDDIIIESPPNYVVDTFMQAEAQKLNIIGNYVLPWQKGTLINSIGIPDKDGIPRFATDDQLNALKNLDPLPPGSVGGLGWYYGRIPLDYVFHWDSNDSTGDDVNFYIENQIKLSYTDIVLLHDKHVLLRPRMGQNTVALG
jgi:hypothetical protein